MKLVLINCKTMHVTAYEGRTQVLTTKVHLDFVADGALPALIETLRVDPFGALGQ